MHFIIVGLPCSRVVEKGGHGAQLSSVLAPRDVPYKWKQILNMRELLRDSKGDKADEVIVNILGKLNEATMSMKELNNLVKR